MDIRRKLVITDVAQDYKDQIILFHEWAAFKYSTSSLIVLQKCILVHSCTTPAPTSNNASSSKQRHHSNLPYTLQCSVYWGVV